MQKATSKSTGWQAASATLPLRTRHKIRRKELTMLAIDGTIWRVDGSKSLSVIIYYRNVTDVVSLAVQA
jgi:hypothetical protein